MYTKKRIIIIGLDGVPFGLLQSLAASGLMPNIQKIISAGTFSKMQSSLPEISSVAWSSIITGKNPAEHGIFGFTDLTPNSYNLRFPNYSSLKAASFWEDSKFESVIINVPSTYPVRPMKGVHISGFVSIDLERSVYPSSLVPKLKELGYCLDVNSELAHQSLDLFLEDLDKSLEARIRTYQHLWDYCNWDKFMLIFTGTDRLMHFLWEAYEDRSHKYHNAFLDHFKRIDQVIGEIQTKLKDSDRLIILSDHGFEGLDKDIYINYFLSQENFLNFQSGKEPSLANLDYSSKAFSLDPARIYIHSKGKYPQGSVSLADRGKVIKDLTEAFYSLSLEGKKIIDKVYSKEEIYHGPFLDQAPDLVLMSKPRFNLKSSFNFSKLASKGPFSGKHTFADAFLLINHSETAAVLPDSLNVYDLLPLF